MEQTVNPFETLNRELAEIKRLITENIKPQEPAPIKQVNRFVNLTEFIEMHPAHPAKQTVYNWINRKKIKCVKSAGKVLFLRAEAERFISESLKEKE